MRSWITRLVLVTSLCLLLILLPCTAPTQRSLLVDYGNGNLTIPSLLLPYDFLNSLIKPSCFYYSLRVLDWDHSLNLTDMFKKPDDRSAHCRFNFDQYRGLGYEEKLQPLNLPDLENTAWFCDLDPDLVCDGETQCLWDECGCQTNLADVFYCFDGLGCVLFERLCDGTQDCIDGSDEGYCVGFARVSYPQVNTDIFLPTSLETCSDENCPFVDKHETEICNDIIEGHLNPLYSCMISNIEFLILHHYFTGECLASSFCKYNCTHEKDFVAEGWSRYCDNLFCDHKLPVFGWLHTSFFCEADRHTLEEEHYLVSQVCDEKVDCENSADEMGCPGRFYC